MLAVLAGGAGPGRPERLSARLEFAPGPGPHLSGLTNVEGLCREFIEHSADGVRAGTGARLAPGRGGLLAGDRAGGVAVAPAQNRELFAAQTTAIEGCAAAAPVAALLVHALQAGLTLQRTLTVADLAAGHNLSLRRGGIQARG